MQTSNEGGRQRYGSKVNSEQLRRGPVLEMEPGIVDKHERRELGEHVASWRVFESHAWTAP